MQTEIDSRCYELTVTPLADVTQAYDQGQAPALEDPFPVGKQEKQKFASVKVCPLRFPGSHSLTCQQEVSAEPEIRDYFSPSLSSSLSPTAPLPVSSQEAQTFSTPERKQIYTAFTFTSPSPSRKQTSTASSSSPPANTIQSLNTHETS